jgi:hypothetical protein
MKETSPKYRYIKVESGLYLSLQQHIPLLLCLIWRRGKAIGLHPRSLPETLKNLRRMLSWLKRLTLYYLDLCTDDSILELLFHGHICLEVHSGYKVFDLYRGTVTKIFKADIDMDLITREIERCRYVSTFDFAPNILKSNAEEKWYEEEYVNGYLLTTYTSGYPVSSPNPKNFMSTYYDHIEKCIEKMILSDKQKL